MKRYLLIFLLHWNCIWNAPVNWPTNTSAVLKYTMNDHFLIYTHIEFKDTKSPTGNHNTVRFRDMKNFDAEIFAHDLMSCDILNGSQDEDEISWEQWKLAYTEICDKHAPMKSLRLKNRSNPWITHDIIKLMYQRDNVHAKAIQKKMTPYYGRITGNWEIK